ncbi:hypothetical protein [Herbidospora daliensis]|nr:hypothetical protein [Herbidospora daliensis]
MRTTRLILRRTDLHDGPRRDEEFDRTGEFRRPSTDHRPKGSRRVRD